MAIKLEVRSKGPNGFRRGGQYFGPEPREITIDDEAQAELIMREGQLFVRRMDGGEMPSAHAPNQEPPFASGLSDGSRFVPSDKTGGKPETDEAGKPKATHETSRRATAPEPPPGEDERRKR